MPEAAKIIRLRGSIESGNTIELDAAEIELLKEKLEIDFHITELHEIINIFRMRSSILIGIRVNELISTFKKIARYPENAERHIESFNKRVSRRSVDAKDAYRLRLASDENKVLTTFLNKYVIDVMDRHCDLDDKNCQTELVAGANSGLAELKRLRTKGDEVLSSPRGRKTNNAYDQLILNLLDWCKKIGANSVVAYDPNNEDWSTPFVLFVEELTQILRQCGYAELPEDVTSTIRRIYKRWKSPIAN